MNRSCGIAHPQSNVAVPAAGQDLGKCPDRHSLERTDPPVLEDHLASVDEIHLASEALLDDSCTGLSVDSVV